MEPEIIVTHIANSSLAGQEQRFDKECIRIGRDAQTDIDFDPDEDLFVSHDHAEIYVDDGRLYIRDLDSRNGTYVNQKRITAAVELQPDDSIHFGVTGPLAKARLGEPAGEKVGGLRGTLLGHFMPRGTLLGGSPKSSGPAPRPKRAPVESHVAEPMPKPAPPEPAPVREAPAPREAAPQPAPVQPAPAAQAPMQHAPVQPAPVQHIPVQQHPAPDPMHMPRTMSPAKPAPKSSWLLPVMLLFMAAFMGIGGTAAFLYIPVLLENESDDPDAAADAPRDSVAALGRLEPDGGVCDVGGPTGLTIDRLLVEEGQNVQRDDELAYLSNYDALQAEYDAALTALDEATSQLETTKEYAAALVAEAQVGVRQVSTPLDLEVATVEAEIELLRAHRSVAVEDREKLEDLGENVDSTQLSRAKLVEQRADRDLEAAERQLEQLRESIKPRRDQAQAALHTAITNEARMRQAISIDSAKKNIDRAKAQLEQAIIRAPRDGTVLKIRTREGSTLTGRPLLQLGDTRDMYVLAEVYETDVRHVEAGQTATIKSAALPDDLEGEVEKVLWTVERNSIRDINPTAPEDLRIVPVRIRIDGGDVSKNQDLLEKLINLQVHVVIDLD